MHAVIHYRLKPWENGLWTNQQIVSGTGESL